MSSYKEKDLKTIRRIFSDCYAIRTKRFTKEKLKHLKAFFNHFGDLVISLPAKEAEDLKGSRVRRFERDMNIIVSGNYLKNLNTTIKELFELIKKNERK